VSGVLAIADLSGAPLAPGALDPMLAAAPDRGPDGAATWQEGPAALGHQALHATEEAAREVQPVTGADGTVRVVADARIDRRDELIAELAGGPYLSTPEPGDAELLLGAWLRWRERFPEHVVGDYAVVVWDARARLLLCARDAPGVKPLHYAVSGTRVVVASEARQVLAVPGVSRRIDESSVADYLAGLRASDARTMFRDVRRLLPGHVLLADAKGVRRRRVWDPRTRPAIRHRTSADYAAHYLEIFSRAVRDRLRTSASAVGIFLSGGLDSCSVAATAARELPAGKRLIAQSLSFDTLADCDERAWSRPVARSLGVEIEYTPAERTGLLDGDVARRPALEGPYVGWESVYGILRARLRERGARVVLGGEAGGYGSIGNDRLVYAHRLLRGHGAVLRELASFGRRAGLSLPRVLANYVAKPLLPETALRGLRRLRGHREPSPIPPWLPPEFVKRTGLAERLRPRSGAWRLLHADAREARRRFTRLDDVGFAIHALDMGSARAGVETRYPFLDRRLIEFVARVPPEEVFRAGWNRLILRRAMRGLLPDSVRLRPGKTKFTPYLLQSIRGDAARWVEDLLDDPLLARLGYVDGERLRRVYRECPPGDAYLASLWFPMTLELWIRENHGKIECREI
jgi:asparagine synthase (glutamine-hydrolysing)